MEAAQAASLAEILAQTVTREDILLVDERLRSMQIHVDARLREIQAEMDARLRATQAEVDVRLRAVQAEVEARLSGMQAQIDNRLQDFQHTLETGLYEVRREMAEMEKRLLWRFVTLLGAFAAVVTALDALLA